MDWLPLTLICAFSLASADAATKRWLQEYGARELVLIRFGFTGLLMLPLLLAQPITIPANEFWYWIAGLIPAEIVAMLLYMRAIQNHPLTLTLPYMAFTPVFVTLTGWLILDEQVSIEGFSGIMLVVIGAWMLNVEPHHFRDWRRLHTPFVAIMHNQGSRLMLLAAFLYSFTSVGGKGAMQYMPPEQFGPFYFIIIGMVTFLLFSLQRPDIGRVLWRRPGPTLLIGLLMGVMVVTHFLALQQVEVAYMIAVKRTSLLFGILYGAWLFNEKGLGLHLFAGGVMVAGVILIVL